MARAGLLVAAAAMALGTAGCGSAGEPNDPEPAATTAPAATALAVPPAPAPQVSNEVPSIDSLMDAGVSRVDAECFVEAIDPDGTGIVENETRFVEAFAACF